MCDKTYVQLILDNCVKLVSDVKSLLSKPWRRVGCLDVWLHCFLTSSQNVGVQST
jgi:hypothetical protein